MSTQESINNLRQQMSASIVGQQDVIENLLIGLLANGNILMEGLPGLAKTRAVKSLAQNMEAELPAARSCTPSPASPLSALNPDPFSPTSFWPMKSTGRRPRSRQRCWKQWKSAR